MELKDFDVKTSDWRQQLQRNEQKTRWIIAIFIAMYLFVGLIVDTVILTTHYHGISMGDSLYALITFQVTPYATIIMALIAMVSLWVTFLLYDRIMLLGTDYHEITPQTAQTLAEKQLYHVVEEMQVAAGLPFMPKVFIIEADYMNAFASGYSEKSAMVAITRGLIEKLDRAELQAVMAHELSHIRHHDIKVTLMVAVLSNILLIVIDILFYSVIFRQREERGDNRLLLVIVVLRYVLPLITVMLALFLSRTREFMADAGCVELMRDNAPMARALLKISQDHEQHAEKYAYQYAQTPHEEVRQASYLFDPSTLDRIQSLNSLFSTHPDVEQRLKAIGFTRKQ